MFGNQNMKDMMSKLQDMKGAVEDSKKRLENIYVKGDALDGKVRFVLDGNRKLKELFIDEEVYEKMEKEDMEKLDDVDDDVFAKLKTNIDKRYEKSSKKQNDNVVDVANKYIYMGKLSEMIPFNVKRTDELSDKTTKKNMSFSMFKNLGF